MSVINTIALKLKSNVIDNGFCVGCGACAYGNNPSFIIKKNDLGYYYADLVDIESMRRDDFNKICPFSNDSLNENEISKGVFSKYSDIQQNQFIGYYLKNYAGYVRDKELRGKGSSGGFGTWIAMKMLENKLVDAIIHVKASTSDELFEYSISTTNSEILEGSKSKYYPIHMAEVLNFVTSNDLRYAIFGLPCFIKAIRLLQIQNSTIKDRIKYTIGLVCGHLKSDMFAKAMALELGYNPNNIKSIDFRVKNSYGLSSDYSVNIIVNENDGVIHESTVESKKLYSTNWGYGFFKYKACDYCDDVLSETADLTIGDAWLPKYKFDPQGTNLLVVRDPQLMKLIDDNINELYLEELSTDQVYQTQAGGFRHKRDGLSYRLMLSNDNEYKPVKRVQPSLKNISNKRKKLYESRMRITRLSDILIKEAVEKNDFLVFRDGIKNEIKKYEKLVSKGFINKTIKKMIRYILKVTGR